MEARPKNCELVLTKDWISLYRLEPAALGFCILLLVGVDKLGVWSLLLIGSGKLGSWSFLPIGVGKQIECNILYDIRKVFCGFLSFGFPH